MGPKTVAAAEQKNVAYYDMMNWQVGHVVNWTCISIVVESKAEGFAAGDFVQARVPWRIYNAVPARAVQKLDNSVPPESHIGMLGGTGLAAYLPIKAFGKSCRTLSGTSFRAYCASRIQSFQLRNIG